MEENQLGISVIVWSGGGIDTETCAFDRHIEMVQFAKNEGGFFCEDWKPLDYYCVEVSKDLTDSENVVK